MCGVKCVAAPTQLPQHQPSAIKSKASVYERYQSGVHIKRIVDMIGEWVRYTALRHLHAAQLVYRCSKHKDAGIAIEPATRLSAIATDPQAAMS